jgi:hypothetical protein
MLECRRQPGVSGSMDVGRRSSVGGGLNRAKAFVVICCKLFVSCRLWGLLCISCSGYMMAGMAGGGLAGALLRSSYSALKLPISILLTSPRDDAVSIISLEQLAC